MTFDWHSQQAEYRKYIDRLMKEVQTPVAQASFAVVGAFLFATFLAVAALRPTLLNIATLLRDIDDERQTVATLDKKIQALQLAQKKLGDIGLRLEPAQIAIPDRASLDEFSKELEVLTKEHGIVLFEVRQSGFSLYNKAIPTAGPGKIPGTSPLSLDMTVGGSEDAIRSFVNDLERLDRLVVVTSVNFSSVTAAERAQHPYAVNANLSVQVFTTQTMSGGVKAPPAASESTGSNL